MRFRPKSTGAAPAGHLPMPGGFHRIKAVRANRLWLVVFALFFLWVFRPLRWIPSFSRHHPVYPPGLPPGCKHTVSSASPYIYPPIEDADLLRQIGVTNLIHITPEDAGRPLRMESLSSLDDADPVKQKIKEDNENAASNEARAINHFKNQAKVVFSPKLAKKSPKIVIVTALDFDRYPTASLAKLVQNRVNYAHEHGYGIYVRWAQEFVPELNSMDFLGDVERSKWIRLFCVRAAMFAFPDAEWFWYFDQDGLVTNMKVDLYSYLLTPDAWRGANLKEQPVIPPRGLIKTYKNLRPANVDLIFTQSETKIETNSFLVRNSEIGRATIETWRARHYLEYNNFPYGPDSAITHILQWHPFVLSKTSIVSARTINSFFAETVSLEDKATDHMHYFPGDFVVQWASCGTSTECDLILQKVAGDV
ncbi:hypothetical protein METBIDRAFT_44326 [Metschnikowia bicuspidata var. bicuspidata NRRL YB-4993]|uniref:Glycosyltransferase family 34 protein n=1 Tax=Metschnikowia bicuspidata var. bicuspidata NRRL YB-4993 TaxID=869754 RepID=A0A1A0H8L9_9ASCO|nr:hypothetical protein METBIDRAFT_44326 [Metschnikowia bicuspidata var. bicuspidata NRRL YB-4993]OBA20340.1 hypothetical protein METBIDRAFT_44326 [Metschnikowia bicuspidata var. bicuspidata NRRL YB-4993]